MGPILFPYTYVPQALVQKLTQWFDTVAAYQPSVSLVPEEMRRRCEKTAVQLRFPVRDQETQLTRILADFHRWSALQRDHRGIGTAYRKALDGGPPFFEPDLPSHIRADIKKRVSDPNVADAEGRDLRQARIFLAIAQELDRQAEALEHDLMRLGDMERVLLESMHEPEEAAAALSAGKAGRIAGRRPEVDFMFGERLAAWIRLLAADPHLRESDAASVFVSFGRTAVETVLEVYPDAAPSLAEKIPPADAAGRRRLQERLAELSRGSTPSVPAMATEPEGDPLVAYVLSGVSAAEAFARIAGVAEPGAALDGLFPASPDTVIVFLS